MWYMHETMGWWMVFGWISFVIFFGGLIALITWGAKRVTEAGSPEVRHAPLDIAKERYARGEISKQEFETIEKDLS